jgi:hypothetical protein
MQEKADAELMESKSARQARDKDNIIATSSLPL